MATKNGQGPHPLDPQLVKKLLDLLTRDEDFRARFAKNAQAALESIGYAAPTGDTAHLGGCLQLRAGATLASPDKIAAARPKLEAALNSIVNFDCPAALYAD